MDLKTIRELLQIVADSGVAEVEIEENDFRLVVRKSAPTVEVQAPQAPQPFPMPYPAPMYNLPPQMPAAPLPLAPAPVAPAAAAPAPAAEAALAAPAQNLTEVRAPIVGTYYAAPSPDADPFVQVGQTVKKGDVLCIIEAMKLMNEIESEVAGTIREIKVENAQPVEFDQVLFLVE
ncbi:MAG: acetyl-CoA carboxylase biotin carboxyl carrier protein, partial [Bacteroidota bacterium]